MATELAPNKLERWHECRVIVSTGIGKFVEVGQALREIRDDRLYLAQYKTFEAYCEAEVGCSARHARRMVDSAAAWSKVERTHGSETPPSLPTPNERQAREIAKVPEDKQAEVWQEAVETAPAGRVTAKHVKAVAEKHIEPEADEPDDQDDELDELDRMVLEGRAAFDEVQSAARRLKRMIADLCDTPFGIYLTKQRITGDVKNVLSALRFAKPHCRCVYCGGGSHSCRCCKGTKWISLALFNQAPEEVREQA